MHRRHLLGWSASLFITTALSAHGQGVVEPTKAQPELPREKLVIVTADGKRHEFNVEVAKTPEQQITGLMFRKSVPADSGMLFVWGHPIDSEMWMKNTLVSLDMVFIGADGRISHIAEDTVPESLAVINGGAGVAATLELQGGITAKLGILVGDHVQSPALGATP